ncbi:TetR/AcrR family transcriptional regulator [Brevundimonas sp. 2R-24]|uniref:TetR/AcrR family transcriptional regulator n=1 Tax=Peiella sedimenti TaxID=3061083 RepID=A0ABT8SHP4_9CAUL|nr:TetR/AcrR family transcriptional regulator [Caulobacteraceae bacterium XZ-24]
MSSAAEVRARVVEAAMELFWAKGYGGTSVAEILAKTDLNAGSLYHVFPGKQDVLIAVLEAYRDGIRPRLLEPAWQGVEDPIERVFALLEHYRRMIVATDGAFGCPIGNLALELSEPDPAVRDLLALNFDNWAAAVTECLAAAGDRLPPEVDRDELGAFVLTTMEGGVMLSRTNRDVAYFDRAVKVLRHYFDLLIREGAREGAT